MSETEQTTDKDQKWEAPQTGYSELTIARVKEQSKAVDLENLPILDSQRMQEALPEGNEPTRFVKVETDKIVGRPLEMPDAKGGWGYEYDSRQGRIGAVAEALKSGDEQSLERVYHLNDPKQRIHLSALRGPAGPIYAVDDGTHRVAGAKLAQIETIPAEVRDNQYPRIQLLRTELDADDMQRKISRGLIKGTVQKVKTTSGEDAYQVTIESEVVPWASISIQNDLVKISRIYEKTYPNSLDNLPVPRDVLVDPIAQNFYMSGKWEDWKAQFGSRERDENGIVIY